MKKIIKKGKNFFLLSVSGVRRRSRKEKNVILRKRCSARFLGIICRKNGVCVGRCMCPRNHGGKKGNL